MFLNGNIYQARLYIFFIETENSLKHNIFLAYSDISHAILMVVRDFTKNRAKHERGRALKGKIDVMVEILQK